MELEKRIESGSAKLIKEDVKQNVRFIQGQK